MAAVLDEGVRPWTRVVELVGVTHSDQIGRDATTQTDEVGEHVAPQVRRRRVAVKQDDRIAGACLDVCHRLAEHVHSTLLERELRGDRHQRCWL